MYNSLRPLDNEKILQACVHVAQWLFDHLAEIQMLNVPRSTALVQPKPLVKTHYDVFISYSHRNAEAAQRIQKRLALFHPDWKVFIDISELKTGVAWQVKLYESIGKGLSSLQMAVISGINIYLQVQFNYL